MKYFFKVNIGNKIEILRTLATEIPKQRIIAFDRV